MYHVPKYFPFVVVVIIIIIFMINSVLWDGVSSPIPKLLTRVQKP